MTSAIGAADAPSRSRFAVRSRRVVLAAIVAPVLGSELTAQPPQRRFAYPEPPTSAVQITRDVPFARVDTTTLAMDIYRPTSGSASSPALIFWSRSRGSDEWIKAWARVAAGNGIVGIIPDRSPHRGRDVAELLRRVVSHLSGHAAAYGIDPERLAVFSGSAGVTEMLPAVEDPSQTSIKAVVAYYGTADIATFRRDLPLLYVQAGLDHPEMNAGILKLVSLAIAQDAPITFLNHHTGRHSFEMLDDDIATRMVIEQTLEFVRRATTPEYQGLLHNRHAEAIAAGHLRVGNHREAALAYADLLRRRPTDGLVRFRYAESLLGDRQFSAACNEYRSISPPNFMTIVPGSRACVLAGQIDSTVAWLRRFPKGWLQPDVFTSDSAFRPLQARADFQALFRP